MKDLKVLLCVLLCFVSFSNSVSAQQRNDVVVDKPGWVNWYAVDTDGDQSPDVLVKTEEEAHALVPKNIPFYIIRNKLSSGDVQVHVIEYEGTITLSIEKEGTPHPPGDKVLHVRK